MPRKLFRKYVPTANSVRENRWIAKFGTLLHHPNLWHLNRDSVAGAVAIGLFAGLIPGPLQMLVALLLSILLRRNLPVALLVTFYTNPFTIVPLYLLAYATATCAWWRLRHGEHRAFRDGLGHFFDRCRSPTGRWRSASRCWWGSSRGLTWPRSCTSGCVRWRATCG